mmetsp:Transcript_81481/g.186472  ORF Transcript_81481/g.186472 Transcript_81481/m.186472 type:complete len:165 (+) Transcript_81481:855-1349(+)
MMTHSARVLDPVVDLLQAAAGCHRSEYQTRFQISLQNRACVNTHHCLFPVSLLPTTPYEIAFPGLQKGQTNMSKTGKGGNYPEGLFFQCRTEIRPDPVESMEIRKYFYDCHVLELSWHVHYCTGDSALRSRVTGLSTVESHVWSHHSSSATAACLCVKTVDGYA